MTEKNEKNMLQVMPRQKSHYLLWFPKNTDNLWYYDFLVKPHYYDSQKYKKKNMYLRRCQGKITLLWYPRNTDKLWFLLKSAYYDAQNFWKKHVFKTLPRQNHTIMIPKKYRYFFLLNQTTMMPENFEKNMYFRLCQGKITL